MNTQVTFRKLCISMLLGTLATTACSSNKTGSLPPLGVQPSAGIAAVAGVTALSAGNTAPPAAGSGAGMSQAGTASAGTIAASTAGRAGSSAGTPAAGSGGRTAAPMSDDDAGVDDMKDAATDSSTPSSSEPPPPATQPIMAPTTDSCITSVAAGDHTFTCGGLTFLMMVDEKCTKFACGLIFDVHGATMSGAQMRDNTLLHKLAPSKGYIVVHPSATASNTGGTWSNDNYPTVLDFMMRTIKAFHIDENRVHFTGFSQGSGMSFWFLCNHHDLLASAAPVSGASNVDCMKDNWKPPVPILYMNGIKDQASTIDRARMMVDNIVSYLHLTGGMMTAGDGHYTRKHWTGDEGMEFDYIEHDYGGQAVLDGHCIPGGVDKPGSANNFSLNATTCTTGDIKINWGELALQWFIDHPRRKK